MRPRATTARSSSPGVVDSIAGNTSDQEKDCWAPRWEPALRQAVAPVLGGLGIRCRHDEHNRPLGVDVPGRESGVHDPCDVLEPLHSPHQRPSSASFTLRRAPRATPAAGDARRWRGPTAQRPTDARAGVRGPRAAVFTGRREVTSEEEFCASRGASGGVKRLTLTSSASGHGRRCAKRVDLPRHAPRRRSGTSRSSWPHRCRCTRSEPPWRRQ